MKNDLRAGTLALGLVTALAAVSAAPAVAAPAPANPALAAAVDSGVSDLGYYRYRHRRYYRYWGGPYYHYSGAPYYRYSAPGFYDQGYAYRGNINGCSIDLGYGRYESCDKGPAR